MSTEPAAKAPAADVTQLVGDPVVYQDLRRLAGAKLRRGPRCPTLEPAVLVHEVYLRLARTPLPACSRAEFHGLAARIMRQILIDDARRRVAAKRGGGVPTVPIDVAQPAALPEGDVTGLREALDRLAQAHPQHARVVQLRYYDGFTIAETARKLARSPATVKREWERARARLRRALTATEGSLR